MGPFFFLKGNILWGNRLLILCGMSNRFLSCGHFIDYVSEKKGDLIIFTLLPRGSKNVCFCVLVRVSTCFLVFTRAFTVTSATFNSSQGRTLLVVSLFVRFAGQRRHFGSLTYFVSNRANPRINL